MLSRLVRTETSAFSPQLAKRRWPRSSPTRAARQPHPTDAQHVGAVAPQGSGACAAKHLWLLLGAHSGSLARRPGRGFRCDDGRCKAVLCGRLCASVEHATSISCEGLWVLPYAWTVQDSAYVW